MFVYEQRGTCWLYYETGKDFLGYLPYLDIVYDFMKLPEMI